MTRSAMMLEPGDVIIGYGSHNDGVVREIIEARPSGYTWTYPQLPGEDRPAETYLSENSNDPYFEAQWRRMAKYEIDQLGRRDI